MAATLSAFDTSPGAPVTLRPAVRRRRTSVVAAASPGRWFSATSAPAPASSSTVARPMPEPPPVTSARLPRRSNLMLTSVGDRLVHHVGKLHAHAVIARLDHEEPNQLFLGIDPKVSAARAGPPIVADAPEPPVVAVVASHANAEAEPVPLQHLIAVVVAQVQIADR